MLLIDPTQSGMLTAGIHPDIRMDGYFHLAGRCPCVLDYTQGPVPDVSLRRRHMGTGYAIRGQSPQAKPLLAVKTNGGADRN